MDEKTEELRDIFTDVADGEVTVTERQEDTRGSLEAEGESAEERLHSVIEQMQDRYDFETGLATEELATVATGFYDDATDDEIAEALDVSPATVFEARMDLHLIADEDADEELLDAIRAAEDSPDIEEVDDETRRRHRLVASARDRSLTANRRYRDEFDAILADADISRRMASDLREDGLEDATEGMETDVSF